MILRIFTSNIHLITILTISYICGLIGGRSITLATPLIAVPLAALLLSTVLSSVYKKRGLFLLSITVLFFLVGLSIGDISSRNPRADNHIYNIVASPVDAVIAGRLKTMPVTNDHTTSVLIELSSFRTMDMTKTVHVKGTVQLRMRFEWPRIYKPGENLVVRAKLQRPQGYKTPGSFDYPVWLARKDIWVTGYVHSPAQIAEIDEAEDFITSFRYLTEKMRVDISAFLTAHLDNPIHSALYHALLLGEKGKLPDYIYEQYKISGVAHILAISGLHISLVALSLFTLFYYVLRRSTYLILKWPVRKVAAILCIPPLIIYTFLAGLNSPVLRAFILVAIVTFAICTDRPKSFSTLISTTALLILAIAPQKLFTASFQLSFSAVIGIALISPVLKRLIAHEAGSETTRAKRFGKWIAAGLLTSVAAVAGTAPLVIYYFNRLPLLSPITNLLIEPLLCFCVLPFGFLSLPFIHVAPDLAQLLLSIGSMGIFLANKVTHYISQFPYAAIWLPSPPLWAIVYYYCALLFLIVGACLALKYRVAGVILFIPALFFLFSPLPNANCTNRAVTVTFLDVGQGSASLIELNNNKTILIDGGGSSLSKNAGERVIAPFLWQKGITHLDGIIITHPDSDHYNGIPFITEQFSPDFIWASATQTGETSYDQLIDQAVKKGVDIRIAQRGDLFETNQAAIACLANTALDYPVEKRSNDGLVIAVNYQDKRILFPGDIEKDTEKRLIKEGVELDSDVLLAAHHGSKTSNHPEFLKKVNPRLVAVSAGYTKRVIYPADHLTDYCLKNRIPLHATHTSGTLMLRYEDKSLQLYRYSTRDDAILKTGRRDFIPITGVTL